MYFKCYCGRNCPSCASGGGVIHIKQLREVHKLNRSQRKTIIRRQWRVQGFALFVCALVIPVNFIAIQLGLHPFLDGLQDIREVNDRIESKVYQGLDIGHRLNAYYTNLTQISLFDNLSAAELCPNQFRSRTLITPTIQDGNSTSEAPVDVMKLIGDVLDWKELVLQGREQLDERFDHIKIPTDALHVVTNATNILDTSIDFVMDYDWYLKLGLLVVDVVVLFWCLGILIAQNNVVWLGMQRLAAYFLMPIMVLLLPIFVAFACVFVSLLLVNAGTTTAEIHAHIRTLTLSLPSTDFCVGNDTYNSPLGSLSDMIEQLNGAALDKTLHYYGMVRYNIHNGNERFNSLPSYRIA